MSRSGWTLNQVKSDVEAGVIVGFRLEEVEGGWRIRLKFNPSLRLEGHVIDYRLNEPRLFTKSDTAIKVCKAAGLNVSTLDSPKTVVPKT